MNTRVQPGSELWLVPSRVWHVAAPPGGADLLLTSLSLRLVLRIYFWESDPLLVFDSFQVKT